jgi:hypothetical protein
MVTEIIGQVLALTGLTVLGIFINRFLNIELTLSCLLAGILASFGLTYLPFVFWLY